MDFVWKLTNFIVRPIAGILIAIGYFNYYILDIRYPELYKENAKIQIEQYQKEAVQKREDQRHNSFSEIKPLRENSASNGEISHDGEQKYAPYSGLPIITPEFKDSTESVESMDTPNTIDSRNSSNIETSVRGEIIN